ncbi:GAF and ANTAR domain-containing protein [Mycolicibacterium sp. P1-18]|uniref:GAF and ANTAR domain-containing protein n=1 Tax=Mycolicibacterium sp. P1-18 TaxID=2024615 RepID=UPI001F5B07E7|nr:GAF and ANTAR domain-containing protein [Mycolicibacterium sp. P1-18]
MNLVERLLAVLGVLRGTGTADQICHACVGMLDVPAAAISLVCDGVNVATLGASGDDARTFDEAQFTVGEGPGLDAVAHGSPMVVEDFADQREHRWPIYGQVLLTHHVRGVVAMPFAVAGRYFGALELFSTAPARMSGERLAAAMAAANQAGLYLLDLLDEDDNADGTAWVELHTPARAEVAQATGMVMAQLNLRPDDALVRLRAHAYATGAATADVARAVVERRLHLEPH